MSIDSSLQDFFPYLAEVKDRVAEHADYFIAKQCQWLNNEDLLTRENSKDIVSTELHPLSFKLLFKNLKKRVEELEDCDLTEPENELQFILLEQVIVILRTILERDDEVGVLIIVSLQLLDLIEQVIKIVERMPHESSKYYKAVIHLSKMLRSFEHSESNVCIAGYLLIKNKWLRMVMQWFLSLIHI